MSHHANDDYLARAIERFGEPVTHHGSNRYFVCPVCGRPKLRVNIAHPAGLYFCVRCTDCKGTLRRRDDDARRVLLTHAQELVLVPPRLEDIQAKPVRRGSCEHRYLTGRGFTDAQIMRLGVCVSSFKGRMPLDQVASDGTLAEPVEKYLNLRGSVIFPIYDDGYRGYQARYLDACHAKRWLSAPGTPRSRLLYNADAAFASTSSALFVAEGIPAAAAFDRLGHACVATFGKMVTERQLARLLAAPQEVVYTAFDGDAPHETATLARALLEHGKHVRVVPFTGTEDPDSVTDLPVRITAAQPYDYELALIASHPRITWRALRAR